MCFVSLSLARLPIKNVIKRGLSARYRSRSNFIWKFYWSWRWFSSNDKLDKIIPRRSKDSGLTEERGPFTNFYHFFLRLISLDATSNPSMECFIFFSFSSTIFSPHMKIYNKSRKYLKKERTRKEINNREPIKGGRGASTVGANRLRSPWGEGGWGLN